MGSLAFFASNEQQVNKEIVRSHILPVFISNTIDGEALFNSNIKGT